MMRKKITLLSPCFEGRVGGIQQFSKLIYEGLYEVADGNLRTIVVDSKGGRNGKLQYGCKVLADVLLRRPSLVIATHLHLARISPLFRVMNIPYWIFLHGVECWSGVSFRDVRSMEGASNLLCVSRFTEARVVAEFPRSSGRTTIFPNHVKSAPARIPKPQARELLGLPQNAAILLTVSRLSAAERYKGHREILSVLNEVRVGVPACHYVIVGEGDDRGFLEEVASGLGVGHFVSFLGALDDSALHAAYCAADAFVMPSTGEGFGIVFLEALVRGIPVLAGNVDGSCDPLRDGEVGVLVNPKDPNALREGICEVLNRTWDPEKLISSTLANFGTQNVLPRLVLALEGR